MRANVLNVESDEQTVERLLEIAANNDVKGLLDCIQCKPACVNAVGVWYGWQRTPLMVAAASKAEVNRSCGAERVTALHCAASSGSVNALVVVELLLDAGADPNLANANGLLPRDAIVVSQQCPLMMNPLKNMLTMDSSPVSHAKDEFLMQAFKVYECVVEGQHEQEGCPFFHPGAGDRRRNPRQYNYIKKLCPNGGKACPRGDMCRFAHGVFESGFHPKQFKTKLCRDGAMCCRIACFLAHSQHERRLQYSAPLLKLPLIHLNVEQQQRFLNEARFTKYFLKRIPTYLCNQSQQQRLPPIQTQTVDQTPMIGRREEQSQQLGSYATPNEVAACSNSSDEGNMATGSSEMDFTLANLVFDVRKHNEETRKRLESAADFVLKHAFDNPHTNPLEAMEFPEVYWKCGNDNFASFMAAKLVTLNMVHLEDDIEKNYPDVDLDSDQELNRMIEKNLEKKEQKNKEVKKPIYPKGTGLSDDIFWAVMKVAPKSESSSSDLCSICMDKLERTMVCTPSYCQHEFHAGCLVKWLRDHTLCPLCKNWVLPQQVEYPNWIKDLGKVRDFLTRDYSASFLGGRYITSVSVLHALMAAHLEELKLGDVLKNFQMQIYVVMDLEKETRTDEHDMIKEEVVEFLKDCRNIKRGLVERFHSFMAMMFIALRLDYVEQDQFQNMMKEVNVNQLKESDSIKKLSRFVQAVKYVQG